MWWVYLVTLLLLALAVFGFVYQVVLGHEFGSNPGPDWFLYATLVLVIFINWLVFAARLILKINSQGIFFRYYPFTAKSFSWKEIESFEIIEYEPMKDYGGWGIRYNWNNKGKAYSFGGNKGLSLTLKNNQKVLIGTAKSEEMKNFLNENNFLS